MNTDYDMGGSFVRLDYEARIKDRIVSRLIELTNHETLMWSKLFINSNAWFYAVDFRGIRFQLSDFFGKKIGTLSIIYPDFFSRDIENDRCRSWISDKVQELMVAIEKQNPSSKDYTRYILDRNNHETFFEMVEKTLNTEAQ